MDRIIVCPTGALGTVVEDVNALLFTPYTLRPSKTYTVGIFYSPVVSVPARLVGLLGVVAKISVEIEQVASFQLRSGQFSSNFSRRYSWEQLLAP